MRQERSNLFGTSWAPEEDQPFLVGISVVGVYVLYPWYTCYTLGMRVIPLVCVYTYVLEGGFLYVFLF